MQVTIKRLPKSEVELSFALSVEEITQDLTAAAARLSERTPLAGFRPGKAPYDAVKNKLGEMTIWNEAIDAIVRRSYAKGVLEHALEPIGAPEITLGKFAPGNPVEFTATATVLPKVTRLAALSEISVDVKTAAVMDADLDAALKELQRMQTRETSVDRPATKADKVTMDLAIERDHVPLEGGQTKGHAVYLAEAYYIPGFTEELVGLKKGDTKSFSLPFPETHYQKQFAGKKADFTVSVTDVAELTPPALDDAFAETVGQKTIADLRGLIRTNMGEETAQKEVQRQELAALDQLVEKSSFEELPAKLLDNETDKMIHELEHSLTERGIPFDEYLKNLGKDRGALKLDFAPQGMKRLKTILALRALAEREGVTVEDADVARELEQTMNAYKDDATAQERVRSEEYADMLRNAIRNRKTIEHLREKTVKK